MHSNGRGRSWVSGCPASHAMVVLPPIGEDGV